MPGRSIRIVRDAGTNAGAIVDRPIAAVDRLNQTFVKGPWSGTASLVSGDRHN
jgi:hypothetical protein